MTAGLIGSLCAQGPISGGPYTVDRQVLDGGGGSAGTANYQVATSSVGGFIGTQSSASYESELGFIASLLSPLLDLNDFESWIAQFFPPGDPDAARDIDHDGDGADNENEFFALTDPTDPSSRFTLRLEPAGPDEYHIRFAPFADPALRSYQLLAGDDLTDPLVPLGIIPQADTEPESGIFENVSSPAARHFFQIEIDKP